MASVRINSTPPGEAPTPIREAWVGLALPLVYERPRRFLGSGVLSGPDGIIATIVHLLTFRLHAQTGYVVPSLAAIEILEKSNPDAARWWRENVPRALRPRHKFLFDTACCERVESG